jgi:enoyl-CoA hydratase/carnithine racemase
MSEDVFVSSATASGDRFVTVEMREGVALIRIDRPKANALSGAVLHQIRLAAESLTAHPPGAVVVWGGPQIFSAGADLKEVGSASGPVHVTANFHAALGALSALPRVTIAAMNGYALGGGLELALACDLRICAEDAFMGLPEVLLGVIPGGGGTQRLPRLIGESRAKDLIFTGRRVEATEALSMGLVNRVVPAASVMTTAFELARELASGAVAAQALAKDAIDKGSETTLEQALTIESAHFLTACETEDANHGAASFRQSGPGQASFQGQ